MPTIFTSSQPGSKQEHLFVLPGNSFCVFSQWFLFLIYIDSCCVDPVQLKYEQTVCVDQEERKAYCTVKQRHYCCHEL